MSFPDSDNNGQTQDFPDDIFDYGSAKALVCAQCATPLGSGWKVPEGTVVLCARHWAIYLKCFNTVMELGDQLGGKKRG